jgi:hypothetical protein
MIMPDTAIPETGTANTSPLITPRTGPGRPLMFSDPALMQAKIDFYFQTEKQTTICGLALACGFCCKETIYEYAKRPEFSDLIKSAMTRIESNYEKRAGWDNSGGGPIFILKNMGWHDKQETEHSGEVSIAQQIIDARKKLNEPI